jgi:hypothetical protein
VPVGWLRVAQPAQAFGVVPEWRCVFQCVGDVEERGWGPGVIEVDEADDALAVPDAVPGAEVAVADDLAGCAGARSAGPGAAGWGTVAGDGVVVAAQERCPPPEPVLWDDLGPSGRTGFAVDPGEDLLLSLGAERARRGEARGLQVTEQAVDGRGPEGRGAADDGSGPPNPLSAAGVPAALSPRFRCATG